MVWRGHPRCAFLAGQTVLYQPTADLTFSSTFCTRKLNFITWTGLIVSIALLTGEWSGMCKEMTSLNLQV